MHAVALVQSPLDAEYEPFKSAKRCVADAE
jgi:hypothetical protein